MASLGSGGDDDLISTAPDPPYVAGSRAWQTPASGAGAR